MTKKILKLLSVILFISISAFIGIYLYLQEWRSSGGPIHAYDKPEGYFRFFREITTPIGSSSSGYRPNYTIHELNKAQSINAKKKQSSGTFEWVQRGPVNVGGRTRCILIDPDDPAKNTWYAGTASGGIWKTTDAGNTWTDIAPDLPNLSTNTLCMAPSNHKKIYAGTGEGYGGVGMVTGNGIFVSNDRGETWNLINSTDGNPDFRYVNKIWVDPDDENTFIAVTNTGILRTTDGGQNWTTSYKTIYRVQDIVQNPLNPDVLYAGINTFGIVKSTDRGVSWFKSSQGLGRGYRISLAVSPVDTSYVYACVENQKAEMDVYISTNSGSNWLRQNDISGTFYNFHKAQGWFNSLIEPHPFKKNVVFVGGVYLGIVEFGTEISESVPQVVGVDTTGTGVFLDFINFGGQFLGGGMSTGLEEKASVDTSDFVSVEIRFGPGKKQKAHRFLVPEGSTSGVPASSYTYQDYVDVPFEAWDIKNNRQLAISFRDQGRDGQFNLIVRTVNEALLGREYIFIQAIQYDSLNPSTLVTRNGGHFQKMMYFFWPMLVAGETWRPDSLADSKIFIEFGRFKMQSVNTTVLQDENKNTNLHVDHHDMVLIPGIDSFAPIRIIDANDGGIAISANSGSTWTQLTNGFITTQFYGVAKRPGANEYIGGMQDNGTYQSPVGKDATDKVAYLSRLEGDGFHAVWNYTNQKKIIASVYNNNFYISTNTGGSWREASTGINNDGPFISKLANSKTFPDILFAVGAKGVYKHTRFGDPLYSWSLISITDGWTIDNTAFASMDVKISLADPNIIWAGAGMYKNPKLNIFLSKDFGNSFDTVKVYDEVDLGLISGMATHPSNPAEAFLLFSYQGNPKIIRTYNYGKSWTDISGFGTDSVSSNGFPDVIVHDLLVFPYDTTTLWAATEIGIFESSDNGANWHILDSNLPSVSVYQIFFQDDQFVAATHGRGIWTASRWPVGIKENNTETDQGLKLYPNPVLDILNYEIASRQNILADVRVISLSGQVLISRKTKFEAGEKALHTLPVSSLKSGTYILEVRMGGVARTARFVKQ